VESYITFTIQIC